MPGSMRLLPSFGSVTYSDRARVGRQQAERVALGPVHAVVVVVDVRVAVEVVAARARDHVDHAARRTAVLGGVARRLDLDFLHEVQRHALALHARLRVGGLDAVDDEAVLAGGRAVDRDAVRLGLEVGARRLRDDRAEVTALGQLHELVGRDAVGALAALDVDERLFGRHLDGFRQARDAKCATSSTLVWPSVSSTRENVFGVKPESFAVTS